MALITQQIADSDQNGSESLSTTSADSLLIKTEEEWTIAKCTMNSLNEGITVNVLFFEAS
ncbi:MAG: hypothetical protein ABW170_23605 [Candidatus Thiodiazotropha sp. L084R]